MYWLYENKIHRYSRIHQSTCSFCQDGQGSHPGSGDSNGSWFGPFADLDTLMTQVSYSPQNCRFCMSVGASATEKVASRKSRASSLESFITGVDSFVALRDRDARYASFDYCFNYFQEAQATCTLPHLLDKDRAEQSCLQLGFYLASWGMFRGKAAIAQHSSHKLIPVIETIINADDSLWAIDAPNLTENAEEVVGFSRRLREAFGTNLSISDTLTTKIMLGVMGTVPAFDRYFRAGFGVSTFSTSSVKKVGQFYLENQDVIDAFEVQTLDFFTGNETPIKYPKSKIIDMGFFTSGQEDE